MPTEGALALLKTFAEIALWRRGPADLPASAPLLAAVMALYLGQSCAQVAVTGRDAPILTAAIADLCASSAVVVALLASTGRLARAPQTLTALLGTGLMLAPAVIALLAGLSSLPATDPRGLLLRLLLLGFLLWDRLIAAHVLRLALDTTLVAGGVLAVLTAIAAYALVAWLAPLPAGVGT